MTVAIRPRSQSDYKQPIKKSYSFLAETMSPNVEFQEVLGEEGWSFPLHIICIVLLNAKL